jgi:hypothetical protein
VPPKTRKSQKSFPEIYTLKKKKTMSSEIYTF